MEMRYHMAILKDLRGYHSRGPEELNGDRARRIRPDTSNSETYLDRAGYRVRRHHRSSSSIIADADPDRRQQSAYFSPGEARDALDRRIRIFRLTSLKR